MEEDEKEKREEGAMPSNERISIVLKGKLFFFLTFDKLSLSLSLFSPSVSPSLANEGKQKNSALLYLSVYIFYL